MAYSAEYRIAWAALAASVNLLHTLVLRGVAQAKDVDEFSVTINHILESGTDGVSSEPDEISARLGAQIDGLLAKIRETLPPPA